MLSMVVLDYETPPPRRDHWPITAAVLVLLLFAFTLELPVLASRIANERANRVKCYHGLRQIGQGILLYTQDQNARPSTRPTTIPAEP